MNEFSFVGDVWFERHRQEKCIGDLFPKTRACSLAGSIERQGENAETELPKGTLHEKEVFIKPLNVMRENPQVVTLDLRDPDVVFVTDLEGA